MEMSRRPTQSPLKLAASRPESLGVLLVGNFERHYHAYMNTFRFPEFELNGTIPSVAELRRHAVMLRHTRIGAVAVHGSALLEDGRRNYVLDVPAVVSRIATEGGSVLGQEQPSLMDRHPLMVYLPMGHEIDQGLLAEHGFDGVAHAAEPRSEIIAAAALLKELRFPPADIAPTPHTPPRNRLKLVYNGGKRAPEDAKNYTILQVRPHLGPTPNAVVAAVHLPTPQPEGSHTD